MDALLLAGVAYGLGATYLFQAIKPYVEAWVVAPSSPLHDPTLRVALYVVAVLLVGLSMLATLPPGAVLDVALAWSILKTAAGAWLVALLTYHALSGDVLGSGSMPAVPHSGPPAAPLTCATLSAAPAPIAAPAPFNLPPGVHLENVTLASIPPAPHISPTAAPATQTPPTPAPAPLAPPAPAGEPAAPRAEEASGA